MYERKIVNGINNSFMVLIEISYNFDKRRVKWSSENDVTFTIIFKY